MNDSFIWSGSNSLFLYIMLLEDGDLVLDLNFFLNINVCSYFKIYSDFALAAKPVRIFWKQYLLATLLLPTETKKNEAIDGWDLKHVPAIQACKPVHRISSFITWWSVKAARWVLLILFSFSLGFPYCSGDVCGFLAMAWCSDIPSTPTLAANVPISGLLRRGGCMGGAEHRRTRDRGETASTHRF